MINSTTTNRFAPRRGPGFSLSEAARIQQDMLLGSGSSRCPRCSASLDALGAARAEGLCMVTCVGCGLSVVVYRRAQQP